MNKRLAKKKSYKLLIEISIIIILSNLFIACGETTPENPGTMASTSKSEFNSVNTAAIWDTDKSVVTLLGKASPVVGQVNIYQEQSLSNFLGMADTEEDGSWQIEIYFSGSEEVPCKLYVAIDTDTESVPVSNAPAACKTTASAVQSREVITLSSPPDGKINSPEGASIDVLKGDSITFEASATDPDGDTSFTYIWDFGSYTLRKIGREITVAFSNVATVNVSLLVRDSTGSWDPTRATITVNVLDQIGSTAPNGEIVRPRGNLTIKVDDSVEFEARGIDPQGSELKYAWDFGGSGIDPSKDRKPGKKKFKKPGVFDVNLKVTNKQGLSDPSPDSVRITVEEFSATNTLPNGLIVSPSQSGFSINVGDTLTLMGSATGPDDDDLSYTWDVGNYGPQKTGQNVEMTFNTLGPVTLKLLVKDKNNVFDPAPETITFNVVRNTNSPNNAPLSEIRSPSTDKTINAGQAVFFSGQALDPDGDMPLHYLWDFDGALPFSTAQTPGAVIFTTPGVYRVTLRAIDSLGQADPTPAFRIITVNGTSLSPPDSIINSPVSDLTINVGSSVTFAGSATDPDQNTPYSYFWDFAGVAPNSQLAAPGAIVFNNAGIFDISLRVTDSTGAKDPTPATVRVMVTNINLFNEPPNGTIITPSMNMEIFRGDSLEFLGTGIDPNRDALSYFWDFNSAAPNLSQINPGYIRFTQTGVYNITLTVTDSAGLSDPTPATVQVTVKEPPSRVAPNGTITQPSSDMSIIEGTSLNFSGIGSDADGNIPLSYLWNFDGAVPNMRTINPGNIQFSTPGVYRVRLSVTDASGLTDPTPAERVITVKSVNSPTGNLPPNGMIRTPAENTQVVIGQALAFTASGIDPDSNLPLNYRWNFDGLIPNSVAQNPGLVTFTQVGTYRIVLSTTDALGAADPTPAERLITVVGNTTQNLSPTAIINSPSSNQTIAVNGTVNFSGSGTDPDNNTPLTLFWDFDGAVANILGRNPGDVTFKKAGTYIVTLNVFDSMGAISKTPATVTITVTDTGSSGGAGGGGTVSNGANWPITVPAQDTIVLNVGSSYTFEGSTTGLDGRQSNFQFWNFGGYFPLNSIGNRITKTFNQPGTIPVRFYSKGAVGGFGVPDSITVVVQ